MTRAAKPGKPADMAMLELAWYRGLDRLIDALDTPDFPALLFERLDSAVSCEMAAFFIYRDGSKPLQIHNSFPEGPAQKGLVSYAGSTYVLNPFYQAYRNGLPGGVYRMRDLAPDRYFEHSHCRSYEATPDRTEEIGYLTDNWPAGREEIEIAIPLADGAMAEICLVRPSAEGGFSDGDLAILKSLAAPVSALVRQFWDRTQAPAPDSRIDRAFEDFGKPELTAREQDVIKLVLRGHSSESIGLNLGISVTTVKSHRKKAYAKLQVSSQSELLSRFLNSLQNL